MWSIRGKKEKKSFVSSCTIASAECDVIRLTNCFRSFTKSHDFNLFSGAFVSVVANNYELKLRCRATHVALFGENFCSSIEFVISSSASSQKPSILITRSHLFWKHSFHDEAESKWRILWTVKRLAHVHAEVFSEFRFLPPEIKLSSLVVLIREKKLKSIWDDETADENDDGAGRCYFNCIIDGAF